MAVIDPVPAIVISTCALLFTVASFWWLNARRGRLRFTAPRVFSCYAQPGNAMLRFPVTLFNTGAVPLVVVDLRLQLSSAGLIATAQTKSFRSSVVPDPGDFLDFPHPYVVPGRSIVTTFVEFDITPAVIATGDPADITLEGLVDRRDWRAVGRFELRTDTVADPGVYITYSNDPAHWGPNQLKRAAAALTALRSGIVPTH